MRRGLFSVALVLALVAPTAAWADGEAGDDPDRGLADKGEIVGILHFEASGVSPTAARAFEDSIERGLTDNGYQVAPRKRMMQMLGPSSYAPGCLFGACLEEVHRNTDVRLVLVGRVSAVGPAYTIVMSLLDTRLGRPMSQVVERCEVCTVEEAITTATLVVVSLTEGAGGAVLDPAAGGGTLGKLPDFKAQLEEREKQIASRRRSMLSSALFFFGAAVLAGGAGAYFVATDQRDRGLPALGAGGAFAVASGTLLVLSRRF